MADPSPVDFLAILLVAVIEYFYVIAWIGMMTSESRQRLGDRWGKTYVVEDP